MAYIETFDDFESTENLSQYKDQPPFAFRERKDKEGTLDWLVQNFDYLEKVAQSRMISYQRWHAMYKGIHWRHIDTRDYHRNVEFTERKPRMVQNFVYELIETKISQMARFGSNFAAIPWNAEIDDENTAKACEKLLKARSYEIDFDKIQREADRLKYKYGTSFIMSKWNKDIGPASPQMNRLREIYKGDIPKDILKKLPKGVSDKVGDTDTYAQSPDRIFPEAEKYCWDKVDHIDEVEWINIYELRAEYPKLARFIQDSGSRNYHNYSTNEIVKPSDMVMVRHFYHKPTKHLPEGAYIKYCDDVILEWTDYPFDHGKLPFVVDRDMEIENELWGRPAIGQIEQHQRHYNNIESGIARDLGVGSAPKWMVPKGAAEFRSLNNEFTIVEFKGPVAPQLVRNNPVSEQAIQVQDRIEARSAKLMKVFDISRGNVPQGITANAALRFLDEQESQVLADDERKRNKRVLKTYQMMMALMQQYYKVGDGRMVRTLGEKNEYLIQSMENADFTKVYDIQLQNTSSLPDTKTGKIAAIVDLNTATQTDPIFGREDIINMLDLGLEEEFVDRATASLDAAKMFLQEMLQGKQVPEPQMHDDLIVHYKLYMNAVQSYTFKTKVPEDRQAYIYEQIKTIEGLLFIKMSRNPKLAQEVSMLNYYPSFFELPAPVPEADYTSTAGEDVVNTGNMENTQEAIDTAKEQESEQ